MFQLFLLYIAKYWSIQKCELKTSTKAQKAHSRFEIRDLISKLTNQIMNIKTTQNCSKWGSPIHTLSYIYTPGLKRIEGE